MHVNLHCSCPGWRVERNINHKHACPTPRPHTRLFVPLQIQDTPGYGDDLDINTNIHRIKRYITEQNKQWHKLEHGPQRGKLEDQQDPRVDLCLFCLPPHRLRNIDLLFMYEVSKVRDRSPLPAHHRVTSLHANWRTFSAVKS